MTEVFTYREYYNLPAKLLWLPFYNNSFLLPKHLHNHVDIFEVWKQIKEICENKLRPKINSVSMEIGLGKTVPAIVVLINKSYNLQEELVEKTRFHRQQQRPLKHFLHPCNIL